MTSHRRHAGRAASASECRRDPQIRNRRYGGAVDTDTAAVDADEPAEVERETGGRRRRLIIALVAALSVAIVVGGLAWAWHWRTHPDVFPEAGDAVGMTLDKSRSTIYVGITGRDAMSHGPVTIDAATPRLLENSARAGSRYTSATCERTPAASGWSTRAASTASASSPHRLSARPSSARTSTWSWRSPCTGPGWSVRGAST